MYPVLSKLIALSDYTMQDVAAHLGVSSSSLRRKMTGGQPWRLEEGFAMMHLLKLPLARIEQVYTPRRGNSREPGAGARSAPRTVNVNGSAAHGAEARGRPVAGAEPPGTQERPTPIQGAAAAAAARTSAAGVPPRGTAGGPAAQR